jgi:hypothetical protein
MLMTSFETTITRRKDPTAAAEPLPWGRLDSKLLTFFTYYGNLQALLYAPIPSNSEGTSRDTPY